MKRIIEKVLLVVGTFLFVYNPPLKFFPLNVGVLIGGGFFVLYLLASLTRIKLGKTLKVNRYIFKLFILISFIVGYSFLVSEVSESHDMQVFKSLSSFLLFYLPGSFGLVHLLKKYFTVTEVLKNLIVITIAQSIIILAMFVNSGVRDFMFSLLRDGSERLLRNVSTGGFKFLGLSFGATWDLSIVQSIGIMLIAVLIKTESREINFKNVLFFLLLALSIFLSGRTGFLGIILGILIIVMPINKGELLGSKLLKFSTKMFIIIIPIFFLVKVLIPPATLTIIESNVLPWAFEMFRNDNGGKFETASSNELKTMYFIPSARTLLIGDGYYVNPYDKTHYYRDTDGGYMRHILFYGIIGLAMLIFVYGLIFYQMYRLSPIFCKPNIVKFYVLLLVLYFSISHIKGDLLIGADAPIKFLLIQYATFIIFNKSKTTDDESVV